MKKRSYFACLLAVVALAVLVIEFPPFQTTWQDFLQSPGSPVKKLGFLLRVYGLPCGMSFVAIILFQMQGRIAQLGVSATSVFPLAVFGSAGMMVAFRSMVSGLGGVPGYALGMALGYTVMSRLHSIQPSGQLLFGRPAVRIVWRGELEAQRLAASRLQSRVEPGGSEHRNDSSSTSNSAKNSSLSLSRAEAGV